MKTCPYCKGEMEYGYLPGESTPVYWLPADKKDSLFRYHIPSTAIELKRSGIKKGVRIGYKAEAYYCHKCRIILAEACC